MFNTLFRQLYFFILIVLVLLSLRNLNNNNVSIAGDWYDYALISSAFYNHYSPDIRLEDIVKTREIIKLSGFNNLMAEYSKFLEDKISSKNDKEIRKTLVLFKAKNGKIYNYHFWFYSLINAPFVLFFKSINIAPFKAFIFVNTLIIWLCLLIIYSLKKLDYLKKAMLSFCLLFSSIIWYNNWIHPELFSSCLIFVSILLLYEEKHKSSILLCALASLQNQALSIIILIIIIDYLLKKRFNIREFIYIGIISSITLIPSLFYYYNFGKANLIVDLGFLSKQNITPDRMFSFFFDFNQGIFLNIPFIIFVFIFIFGIKIATKKASIKTISIPISILIMSIISIQQVNWNMGEAVIIRYGTWISTIIIAYTIIETNISIKKQAILFSIIAITQLIPIKIFGGYNCNQHYMEHNIIAKYTFKHNPQLYNPDFEIFAERTLHKEYFYESDSPIIYKDENNNIRKILIHKNTIQNLPKEIKIPNDIKFKNNWAYINMQ